MDPEISRRVLKQQNQLQSLEFAIERCEGALLDLTILLQALKKSNKELKNITAKSGNGARRPEYEPKPSFNLSSSQRSKYAAASRATPHTDSLEYHFRRLNVQNKQLVKHPKNKSKN